ncbi:helix-turn-helix domain-containing protein [Kordiimonas sp.]|uniref:helix-turn-helix domain-containing protein n=1 Tax=Kordiimonas sp. TaxID=1970157 RepID=UPI003B52B24A
MTITGEQIRAARELIRWRQSNLAEQSGVSLDTIKRLEAIRGEVSANVRTVDAIVQTFRDAGVRFLEKSNDAGVGVRVMEREE